MRHDGSIAGDVQQPAAVAAVKGGGYAAADDGGLPSPCKVLLAAAQLYDDHGDSDGDGDE